LHFAGAGWRIDYSPPAWHANQIRLIRIAAMRVRRDFLQMESNRTQGQNQLLELLTQIPLAWQLRDLLFALGTPKHNWGELHGQ
jgi:hypothetical protein